MQKPPQMESANAAAEAEIIFVNGDIFPGESLLERYIGHAKSVSAVPAERAQALAVRDGRIISVGSNADIEKLKGMKTAVVDLAGHFVMPGFNDAHVHLAYGGFERLKVELVGTKSLDDMKSRIAAHVQKAGPGEWIEGRGWDHTLWLDGRLPTRQDLDAVTAGHPAIFGRVDGHIAVANTEALKLAGITSKTAVPPGGKIDRDAQGEPTGILREAPAMELVRSKIPKPNAAQRRRGLELVFEEAARWGVTSAQDNSEWEDFLVCEQLKREGKLTLRISEWLPFKAPIEELKQRRDHHPHSDLMLHTGMLKGFMDGSLGSRTAAMLAPYTDDPGNSGLPQYEQAKLDAMTKERAAAGFQIGFHAIGDRGVDMALKTFAAAEAAAPDSKRLRFRIEHAQVLAPGDIDRFRKLGVIASMQPSHLLTDMNWAEARIGPERARFSYDWKGFARNGVPLAFGTDFPVEPITPFRGLYVAVTRKNEAGTKQYVYGEPLNIDEAIAAYTVGAAYAEFAEQDKGFLAPGKLADFVVLDRDITKIAPAEILGTKVLRTVIGGKTVYAAEK
ncbi:MAG TPA: amidohydrolase [Terriglobales bacterium]|nr:amidohydrolase [Terriglobales bacterium]